MPSVFFSSFTALIASSTVSLFEANFVPNAADDLTQAFEEKIGTSLGLAKNIIDVSSISVTLIIGIIFARKVIGIGIGTLTAVLCVGRAIALFN